MIEYITKSEIMSYLEQYRKTMLLENKDAKDISAIIREIDGMYTYRPVLTAKWIKRARTDFITCSCCGFQTLVYKNSKYCPNCGKLMTNGKAFDKR